MYFTLGKRMNILITRSFDPLAEQLDDIKGYCRHKSEMFRQSSNLRGCVAAKLRPVTANIGWYVVPILHDQPSCNIDIT